MDFEIFYTEPALADLEEILAWSWAHHPATTERFANSLLNHVDLLSTFPYLGTRVRGYAGVRRLSHSPLGAYYRIHEDLRLIEILHFWHGARIAPKF